MDIEKNPKFLQAYNVTISRHSLSALELRIMTAVIYGLKKYQLSVSGLESYPRVEPFTERTLFELTEGKRISILAKDILQDSRNTSHLVKSLKALRERSLTIKVGKTWAGFGLINEWTYGEDKSEIRIHLSDKIIPALLELGKNYTKAGIQFTFRTQNKYAIRWYQLASHWLDKGIFQMTPAEIRDTFRIRSNAYLRTGDFSQWIIKDPIKEINARSDIHLEATPIKKGRNITSWRFTVKKQSGAMQQNREIKRGGNEGDGVPLTPKPRRNKSLRNQTTLEFDDEGFYSRKMDRLLMSTERERRAWRRVFEEFNLGYDYFENALIRSCQPEKIKSVGFFVRGMTSYYLECFDTEHVSKEQAQNVYRSEMRK